MEKIYIILTIILIIIIISIIYSHINIDITKYEIKNKKIDKDLTIIFLSDLHNRNITKKIVDIIKNIKVDIILFGGDMINDNNSENKNFLKLYNKLKNNTIYYTFGNHEERLEDIERKEYLKKLSKTNINLLNNSKINISKNITILGLDSELLRYMKFGRKGLDKEYITNKLGTINTDKYNILLAHNPLEFNSYVDYNADLVLSGHIHGGLIRIPFIKGLLSPDISFFPKYDSGEYNSKNTKMIVSRGLGYSKRIPFRVFNPAEVVIINLKKEI